MSPKPITPPLDSATMSNRPPAVRVCLVGDGTSVHLRRWAADLRDAGLEISVLSYRGSSPLPGIEWQVASLGPPVLRQLFGWVRTRRFLRRVRPDIVHLHFLPYGPRGLWALGTDAKVVANPYGTDIEAPPAGWRGRLGRHVVRAALRRADAVVTASRYLMERTAEMDAMRRGTPRAVIGFGVDCEQFRAPTSRAAGATDAPVAIGYAKGLHEYYGALDLMQAVAIISADPTAPPVRLRMAGAGPLEARLPGRIVELGLTGIAELLGPLADADLPSFYADLDIFAMPSHREAYGVAALEAGAMELPVVATTVGGIGELVRDGATGLLVSPGEPAALAAALLRLVDDASLRRRLGAGARAHVCREHGRAAAVVGMVELYRRVLGAPGG